MAVWWLAAGGAPEALGDAGNAASLNVLGPPLTSIERKLSSGDWLVAFLMEPSRLQPGTTMPDAGLSAEEAQAMAAYLYSGGAEAPVGGQKEQRGDPEIGAKLFVARGCRGCHASRPGEEGISSRVPNLAGTGLKVRPEWLFNWIKSPRGYDPHTAMPQLALTDEEITHLVAFLLARREGAAALDGATRFDPQADAAKGKALLERYECGSCHRTRGLSDPEPAVVLSGRDTDAREAALRDGRLLVELYNCRGCHRIEGKGGAVAAHLERKTLAPPTLEGEGARVQSSWLIDFLQQPEVLRPWLEMSMPDYALPKERATALARYFAAVSDVSATDEVQEEASEDVLAHGLQQLAAFKCAQCHPAAAGADPGDRVEPAGDPDRFAIDLALARKRLRPSWIRKFLARPKTFLGPDTRMPAVFYSSDGVAKVADPERDIAAITAYLMQMQEPLDEALAQLKASEEREEQQEQIDWTTYEY